MSDDTTRDQADPAEGKPGTESVEKDVLDNPNPADEGEQGEDSQSQKTLEGRIKSAQNLLNEGKKELKDFPDFIQKQLTVKKEKKEKVAEVNEDRILEKLEDKQLHKAKFKEFKGLEIGEDLQNKVMAKADDLEAHGYLKGEALEMAMESLPKSEDLEEAEERGARQVGQALPSPSAKSGGTKTNYTWAEFDKITAKNPAKHNELMNAKDRGEITIS